MRKNNQVPLKYSQNFLKSPKLVEKIVKQVEIKAGDLVFEIGPGKGIITEQLAKRGAKVIAIEKDKNLYEELRKKFAENQK